ncbi:fimbrial protein [Escherichia coli]|nr:fimbrial protein [Salmonella enterica subsp. enterica]EFG2885656.1 fimbrial protein [Escherichia coli]
MNSPVLEDDEQEKPLDPAVERVRKKIIRFMLINLGVLGVTLMAVVLAIVYKTRSSAPETPAVVAQPGFAVPSDGGLVEASIALPAGAKILSQSLSGERALLQVEEPGGAQALYLYDLAGQRMIGRFAVKAN